jgi:hypothetical protein
LNINGQNNLGQNILTFVVFRRKQHKIGNPKTSASPASGKKNAWAGILKTRWLFQQIPLRQ